MPGILSPLSKTVVFCVSLFFLRLIYCASPNIIISEIHFNPNGPDEAREFIEIKNVGQEIVDLSVGNSLMGFYILFQTRHFWSQANFVL